MRQRVAPAIYGVGMFDWEGVRSGFAVVDVETTGFSASKDRIVEVAVVVLDGVGVEVEAFCTLLDPGCDPGPTHVHGITPDMVAGAPSFGQVHHYLAGLLSGRVMVGHNVDRFDLGFLRAECERYGGVGLVPGQVPLVDTMSVARTLLDMYGRSRLVDCCDHFGLTWDQHHSALGDARVTASLFVAMRRRLGDDALGLEALMSAASDATWPGAGSARPVTRERAWSSPT
jgi:DNA polymerase III subunit epsilon